MTQTVIVQSLGKRKKVCELTCNEIRWFYRKEGDTKWISFKGILDQRFYNMAFLEVICNVTITAI